MNVKIPKLTEEEIEILSNESAEYNGALYEEWDVVPLLRD